MEIIETLSPILSQQILRLPFYITQISLHFCQRTIIQRKGTFEDYQLAICTSGSGIFACGGQEYQINEQDAFLFAPHVPHSYYPAGSEPWMLDWVCYNGQSVIPLYGESGYCILREIPLSKIAAEMHQMYSQMCKNNFYRHLEASQTLYALLMELIACQYGAYQISRPILKLEPVISYMEQHFAEDLSLETLAEQIQVSVSYLCRLFQSAYQMSPLQYLIHFRISHAKRLMSTFPQMTMREISARCGYKDASYFGAEFKRSTGLSPAAYRNRLL